MWRSHEARSAPPRATSERRSARGLWGELFGLRPKSEGGGVRPPQKTQRAPGASMLKRVTPLSVWSLLLLPLGQRKELGLCRKSRIEVVGQREEVTSNAHHVFDLQP